MTNQQLKEIIEHFGIEFKFSEAQYLTIEVPCDKLYETAKKLKENELTKMDYLILITGVDYKESFGCTYMLNSTSENHTVIVKTKNIDKVNPQIDSVSSLWHTADFHEREIFDLLGIKFNNHPDLRRIFLDENWEGYPLRKDYTDEKNIIQR
jgi:NADH:ubiquinone oxidoreductase subunit C